MKFIGILLVVPVILFSGVGCARHLTTRARTSPKSLTFTLVSAGQDHTCALTAEGDVHCWGSNQDGQLGIGTADKSPHRKPLRIASTTKFTVVNAGYRHSCALSRSGAAF